MHRSMPPLLCGRYGIAAVLSTPNSARKAVMSAAVNCEQLSERIERGISKIPVTSNRNLAAVAAEVSLTGFITKNLVKLSISAIM